MSEMAQTADHLIVLGRGRIIANSPVADIVAMASGATVIVRSPEATRLAELLSRPEVAITAKEPTLLEVHGLSAPEIGAAAAAAGVVLHELTPLSASLEEAFMELTKDDVEYHAGTVGEEASA
jgi:ABC-2 type transport system ATP-binding protein